MAKNKQAKIANKNQKKAESSSDDSSSDSSSDSSDEEEVQAQTKPKAVTPPVVAAVAKKDDSSDSSDSDSSDSSDEEETETKAKANNNKRKLDAVDESASKKAKTENGSVAVQPVKVYFSNLPSDVTDEVFLKSVKGNPSSVTRQFVSGYVEFADQSSALEGAGSVLVNGKEIKLSMQQAQSNGAANYNNGHNQNNSFDKPKREFAPSGNAPSGRMFVGNLPFQADEYSLREFFSSCGELTDVHVATDRETGRPKGFAHVEFADPSGAEKAFSTLNGADFNGRAIRLDHAAAKQSGGGGFRGAPRGGGGFRGGAPRGGGFRGGPRGGGRGGRPASATGAIVAGGTQGSKITFD